MEGVVRIVHDREHDQLQLLGRSRHNRRLPSVVESIETLQEYILKIEAVSGSDIVLAFAFSNLIVNDARNGSGRQVGRTHLIYPLHDETLEYTLKSGEYYASMNGDPITILPGGDIPSGIHSSVLCARNPFLNSTYRPTPLGILLQKTVPDQPKNWRAPVYE